MTDYRTHDVPVDGGTLRVGEWGRADPKAPVVLLVHGVATNHLSMALVAERLTDFHVVAPDLRGRGRSADVGGPYGMARHADDLALVLDSVGSRRAVVVGHSMGAFVTAVFGSRHPSRVSSRIFVDGGLPVISREALRTRDVTEAMRPILDRLSTIYPSVESYRQFWQSHPAFAEEWNPAIEAAIRYDLVGRPPQLRSSVHPDVVLADGADMLGGPDLRRAIRRLLFHRVDFLRAPVGHLNGPEPLYSDAVMWLHRRFLPRMAVQTVPGVNHYTITMSDRGADAVAEAVRRRLPRAKPARTVVDLRQSNAAARSALPATSRRIGGSDAARSNCPM